jgi:ribonuclease P protein component
MLSRKYRFHGHSSLKYVFKTGKTARNRSLMLRFGRNERSGESRLSVVVSKKVFKSSAKRNRIRRRIYEAVRRHWDEIDHPYDLVFTVFDPMFFAMPADELENNVVQLLAQTRVLRTGNVADS